MWKFLEEEKRKLQQLKDTRYSNEMEYSKEMAESLYLRGVGSVWDAVQQEQAVKNRIAANRQALVYMSADDPRRKTLEHEIQQDLARLNGAKKIASDHGINYNDLVDYAQRLVDAERTKQNQQKWQETVRESDRMMNAANWVSVPLNVVGGFAEEIADGVQGVKNFFSREYRPVNRNSNLYYGSNMADAIRDTTRDVIHERLGDGVGGYVGEFVYDVSMGLLDSALEWGVGQIIAGSNLLPDNTRDFLEKMDQAAGFVNNNVELMQTYQEALENGATGAEAFEECVKILVAEGLWNGMEKKLGGSLSGNGSWDSEMAGSEENLGMVLYQPGEQDDFLTGFYADDTRTSGKADFYVSPSGEAIPGEYGGYIGDNQRAQILSQIDDQTLRSVVGQMYPKDSVIGTGSLAETIRYLDMAGMPTVSTTDRIRAERAAKHMENRLRTGALAGQEKALIEEITAMWNTVYGA